MRKDHNVARKAAALGDLTRVSIGMAPEEGGARMTEESPGSGRQRPAMSAGRDREVPSREWLELRLA